MSRSIPCRLMGLALTLGAASPSAAVFPEHRIVASDASAHDEFGRTVAVSGDFAISGSQFDDDLGAQSGSAYIYRRDGATWIEEDKLLASDGAAGDRFGFIVAISGPRVVIGAPFDQDAGEQSGAAYVFRREATGWVQEAKLTASDAAELDRFGYHVAIGGRYVVVGAYRNDESAFNGGAAYVFRRDTGGWYEEAKLTASDAVDNDYFGFAVSISGDYEILVGAYLADSGGPGSNHGAAYVFTRDESGWTEEARLTASDPMTSQGFGFSVQLAGDLALVAANWDDDLGDAAGAAYVFRRTETGWMEEAKLTASDGGTFDFFGHYLSVSANKLLVGAFGHDGNTGSAYLYAYDGSNWPEEAVLAASDEIGGEQYGQAVSISGNYAIIGAPYDNQPATHAGSAYIYDLGVTWTPSAKDIDRDHDLDRIDFDAFEACMSGAGTAYPAGTLPDCGMFDSDQDGDVDQADYGAFQRCLSGDGEPYPPGC